MRKRKKSFNCVSVKFVTPKNGEILVYLLRERSFSFSTDIKLTSTTTTWTWKFKSIFMRWTYKAFHGFEWALKKELSVTASRVSCMNLKQRIKDSPCSPFFVIVVYSFFIHRNRKKGNRLKWKTENFHLEMEKKLSFPFWFSVEGMKGKS